MATDEKLPKIDWDSLPGMRDALTNEFSQLLHALNLKGGVLVAITPTDKALVVVSMHAGPDVPSAAELLEQVIPSLRESQDIAEERIAARRSSH